MADSVKAEKSIKQLQPRERNSYKRKAVTLAVAGKCK